MGRSGKEFRDQTVQRRDERNRKFQQRDIRVENKNIPLRDYQPRQQNIREGQYRQTGS